MSSIDEKAYYEALGRFISEFSEAENHIVNMHRLIAGVSLEKARAIFSGLRAEEASKQIKRMLEISDPSSVTEFEWVFKQLTDINEIRNSLVHYGTRFSPEPKTTNAARATNKNVKEFPVSLEILAELTADIKKIGAHCFAHVLRKEIEEELKIDRSNEPMGEMRRHGILREKTLNLRYRLPPLTSISEFRYSKPAQPNDRNKDHPPKRHK